MNKKFFLEEKKINYFKQSKKEDFIIFKKKALKSLIYIALIKKRL